MADSQSPLGIWVRRPSRWKGTLKQSWLADVDEYRHEQVGAMHVALHHVRPVREYRSEISIKTSVVISTPVGASAKYRREGQRESELGHA